VTPTSAPAPAAPEVEERTVELDGARLRVLSAGGGPVLVYLHGVGDLGSFIPPLALLAERYRVIRPDHPGFNGSDDLPVDSPADVAAVHSRLLDALGVTSAVLVGCSFGGWVAAELALREPERITRLVLIDPAGMPADEAAPRVPDMDPVEAAALTFAGAGMRAAAQARAAGLAESDPTAYAYDRRNRQTAARLAGDPYMCDPGLPAKVAALTQPVSVLWGEEDRIVPLSHARSWTDALPAATLAVVPGAGHLPHAEQPAEFFARADLGVAPR
jgi:pimeloyl-ACP methyl ester carboxylesterase